jgi:hypothetical protein
VGIDLFSEAMVAVYAACTNLRLLHTWARRTLRADGIIPLLTAGNAPNVNTPDGASTGSLDAGPPAR